jgi:hypothetical protein
MSACEWTRTTRGPDVPVLNAAPEHPCAEQHMDGYTCTRALGHTGRHAAGGSEFVCAVWEQS